MPTLDIQGTKFTFRVLPPDEASDGYWAKTEIVVENEYVSYREILRDISREELEEMIFACSRLLAGAYGKGYRLPFEKSALSVELYPHTRNGAELSREERRQNDCYVAFRILFRAKDGGRLGGMYSLLLHRKDVELLSESLRVEFEEAFARFGQSSGKYLFVGVSPRGYKGCNYWYLDKSGRTKPGDYVWVRMGRRNIEQIVYVDSVKYCSDDTAPYDPARVKQVLRKAKESELYEE